MLIFKVIKEIFEDWYFIYYFVIIFINVFVYCGIILDIFFCENFDWFGWVFNWVKFLIIVVLGFIYCGSWVNGNCVVKFYFFGGVVFNKYSEGGVFFVFGFIYVGCVEFVEEEFKKGLVEGNDFIV